MKQILCAFSLLLLIACTKSEDRNKQEIVPYQKDILKVEGATIVNVKDTVRLTVFYPYSNGCDVITSFEETKQGNIIIIKAMGGYPRESICTQDAGTKTKLYSFVPATAGQYELRFLRKDNSVIAHSITVN